MIPLRQAAGITLAACWLLILSGCVTRGPLIEPSAHRTAAQLDQTPFFPQRIHQCGPAALATVLGASQIHATPDEIEPLVYLPGKRGSLQIEMLAAPRRFGRLTYGLEPQLEAILSELDAGRPVLILHNYGIPWLPRWHYAVAIGYDAKRDELYLRSGTVPHQVLSSAHFMRAWDNGGRWAMVVLRPGELPTNANRARYLEAAAAFERVAKPEGALLAFKAAVEQWPDEPIAWIGLGTARYRSGDLKAAAESYAAALRLDASQTGARNNLAMTLLELGCTTQARKELAQIDMTALSEPLRAAVADTRAQVDRRPTETCRLQELVK